MPALSLPEPADWPRETQHVHSHSHGARSRQVETFTATQPPHAGPAHARWGVVELAQSAPQSSDQEQFEFEPTEVEAEPRAPIWLHTPPPLKNSQGQAEPPTAPDPLDWRPPPTFRERVLSSVGTPAIIGILVFIATVASVVILVLAQSHSPSAETERVADSTVNEGQSALNESTVKPNDGSNAVADSEVVYVHVVGEVNSPGVIELKTGDRVQQALEAAGGVTKKAILVGVNLARTVSDGEQIVVPDSAGVAAVESSTQTQGSSGDTSANPVNLNTSDAVQLESLPRVGPALAQRIIEWREANGAFSNIDQLLDVSGIGQKTLDGFRDRIRV